MKKKFIILLIIFSILFINCVTASDTNLNNTIINLTNKHSNLTNFINKTSFLVNLSNDIKYNLDIGNDDLINKFDINPKLDNNLTVNNSSNIHPNTTNLVNLNTDKNKYNISLFNGSLYNQSQYNRSSKLGLNNSFVNNVSKELNISKEVNLTNNIKSSNIHYNKFNLLNLTIDKNKQGIDLFNDTLHNKNQYNKTCKLLRLNNNNNNNSINPVIISKELNISKSNSNICDDFREDNFLINPIPKSDNKNYNIMLLIPILLVLLGAIILYKKNK